MERRLEPDPVGELGEPIEVLADRRGFAGRLPEEELAEDQVESQLGVGEQGGESLEVPLGEDRLAVPAALPLVGPEDRDGLLGPEPRLGSRGRRRRGDLCLLSAVAGTEEQSGR